jgi:hypothetical protein
MLVRLGRVPAPTDQIKQSYQLHLERLYAWLDDRPHMARLVVRYSALMADPMAQANRVNDFLGGRLDTEKMVAAVDPTLYRNRAGA